MAAVLVIGAVLLGPQCMAQVLTTVEEAGPADCVYIAGNPDLYPIEYYDSEQQCYRGILPEAAGNGGGGYRDLLCLCECRQ